MPDDLTAGNSRTSRRTRRPRFDALRNSADSAATIPMVLPARLPELPQRIKAPAGTHKAGTAESAAAPTSHRLFLALPALESDAVKIERMPLSVSDLIAGLREILEPVAREQGVDFSVSIERNVPAQVLADAPRLRQVLFNFLGNAIKFSGDRPGQRGRVRLQITVARERPLSLDFAVIDNGIGMSPELLKRLSTPATPATSSTTRTLGTGVGLAVCRRLAALLGGQIAVASALCEGSTFTLTLPVQAIADRRPLDFTRAAVAPAAPAAPVPSVAESPLRGAPILLAEDDEFNAKMIVRQLQLLGRTVEVARDGAEALRMWRSGRYSLLLTDLRMPRMDGCELAQTIRIEEAATGTQCRPILAVTAHSQLERTERAQASGIDEYLIKPLPLQKLHVALKHWLAISGQSNAADDRTFDLQALRDRIGDDPTIVRDFLLRFRSAARRLAKRAQSANKARDLRGARVVGQQLGHWAKSIGAETLDGRCDALENAALAGDEHAAWRALTPLLAALLQVEADVSTLLQ